MRGKFATFALIGALVLAAAPARSATRAVPASTAPAISSPVTTPTTPTTVSDPPDTSTAPTSPPPVAGTAAYRDRLHEQLDLADGIRDWLIEAADAGLRLAVASSSPVAWVRKHLARAGVLEMFDVVAGSDQVKHPKPAPDAHRLALDRLDMHPNNAVAVEATPHGVDAAHAAGLGCIAIPNPFVTATAVAHADARIATAAGDKLLHVAEAALG